MRNNPEIPTSIHHTKSQINGVSSIISSVRKNLDNPSQLHNSRSSQNSYNSKYHIQIEDQHTSSKIDLTVRVGDHPSEKQYRTVQPTKTENFLSTQRKYMSSMPTERKVQEKAFAPINYSTNQGVISFSRIKPLEQYPQTQRKFYNKQHIVTPSPKVFQYGEESPPDYGRYQQSRQKNKEIQVKEKQHQINVHKNYETRAKTVSVRLDKVEHKEDLFKLHKNAYLSELKRKQRISKRPQRNEEKSSKKNKSLSPEVQRITNRLYERSYNQQPCPRCVKHHIEFQKKAQRLLCQYSFLNRYMSQSQLQAIICRFERDCVPEYQWPMKIVSLVYDKKIMIK